MCGGAAGSGALGWGREEAGREGWGRGEGRRLDRDTEDAGEGDPGWLLFLPGDQWLGMGPPATGTVLLGGWPCRVIKGCLGSASSPSPGEPLLSALWWPQWALWHRLLPKVRSSWELLPSPPPPSRCLLGPQRGAPPSGEVCAVRCDRTPEASPYWLTVCPGGKLFLLWFLPLSELEQLLLALNLWGWL